MLASEVPQFAEAANAMMESFSARPLSQSAVTAWFTALMEFPLRDVAAEMSESIRRLRKPPTCADIWTALNERRSQRIEDDAKQRRATEKREVDDLFRGRSDYGVQQLAVLRRMLGMIGAPTGTAWAHRIMDRVASGADVPIASVEMARRALRWAPEDVAAIVAGGRAALAAQRARESMVEREPVEEG